MGCVQSGSRDAIDIHPNVYRVVNIDEGQNDLWAGQLEVTESDLILYRQNKEPTKWPLNALRRYGFEGDLFSFEAGRRCPTGQGIYAFRCRRAEDLFRSLQLYIQTVSLAGDGLPFNFVGSSSPVLPADLCHLQLTANAEAARSHVEPLQSEIGNSSNRFNGNIQLRSSNDGGPISPDVNSPGSPSSANILEVMPLNTLSENSSSNHVTNLYQFREFPLSREHNNNKKSGSSETRQQHSYCNDVHRDLAILRNTLTRGCPGRPAITSTNEIRNLSPSHSNTSEHYALLSVNKEPARLYMNLGLCEKVPSNTRPLINGACKLDTSLNVTNNFTSITSGLIINHSYEPNISECDETKNCYANIRNDSTYENKSNRENCIYENPGDALDNKEDIELNYALLDIDSEKQSSQVLDKLNGISWPSQVESRCMGNGLSGTKRQASLVSENSMFATGYTTIDFNKTAALSSVALGSEMEEGSRRTRHNSTALSLSENT